MKDLLKALHKYQTKMEQQTYQQPMQEQPRKSNAWIWILIILILVGAGIGIWLWLSGGSGTEGLSSLIPSGSSIPQPPALPN